MSGTADYGTPSSSSTVTTSGKSTSRTVRNRPSCRPQSTTCEWRHRAATLNLTGFARTAVRSRFEQRRLTYVPLNEQSYALDFETTLTAQADLMLDRTLFTTWGGYGGLIVRGNRNWQQTRLLFPDGSTSDRPTGVPATWCDLSGKFDGGLEQSGGVAIFDHPHNPRHPTPWYGATGPGHYINAAVLFHEPMQVASGRD